MLYLDGFRTLPTSAYRPKADIKTEVYERPLLANSGSGQNAFGGFLPLNFDAAVWMNDGCDVDKMRIFELLIRSQMVLYVMLQ